MRRSCSTLDSTISATVSPSPVSTSISTISLPSLSDPMGSYKDNSPRFFRPDRRYIKISFSMHLAAYVASLVFL